MEKSAAAPGEHELSGQPGQEQVGPGQLLRGFCEGEQTPIRTTNPLVQIRLDPELFSFLAGGGGVGSGSVNGFVINVTCWTRIQIQMQLFKRKGQTRHLFPVRFFGRHLNNLAVFFSCKSSVSDWHPDSDLKAVPNESAIALICHWLG